jgi:hypothetical protein
VIRTATLTRPFTAGEPLYLFADRDPETETDDVWLETTVQDADGGQSCGSENLPAQNLTVTGLTATEWSWIRQGAQVRSWDQVEYTTGTYAGDVYLVRIQEGETARLVGPLAATNGLRLEYLDQNGAPTATATEVRNVRLRLKTSSAATTERGGTIGDSLVTTVQLRN